MLLERESVFLLKNLGDLLPSDKLRHPGHAEN